MPVYFVAVYARPSRAVLFPKSGENRPEKPLVRVSYRRDRWEMILAVLLSVTKIPTLRKPHFPWCVCDGRGKGSTRAGDSFFARSKNNTIFHPTNLYHSALSFDHWSFWKISRACLVPIVLFSYFRSPSPRFTLLFRKEAVFFLSLRMMSSI